MQCIAYFIKYAIYDYTDLYYITGAPYPQKALKGHLGPYPPKALKGHLGSMGP